MALYRYVYYYHHYYFFDPGRLLNSQGMKKITLCNPKKYKNLAGMNLTSPPPPSQKSHAVRWHCIAESERRVAEIKSCFLCRRPTDQQACDRVSKGRRDPTHWLDPVTQRQLAKNVMSLDVWIFRRLTSGCLFCCWPSFTGSCCDVIIIIILKHDVICRILIYACAKNRVQG